MIGGFRVQKEGFGRKLENMGRFVNLTDCPQYGRIQGQKQRINVYNESSSCDHRGFRMCCFLCEEPFSFSYRLLDEGPRSRSLLAGGIAAQFSVVEDVLAAEQESIRTFQILPLHLHPTLNSTQAT